MEPLNFEKDILPIVKEGFAAYHAKKHVRSNPYKHSADDMPRSVLLRSAWLSGYGQAAGLVRHNVREYDETKAHKQIRDLRHKVTKYNDGIETRRVLAQYQAEALF